MVGELTRKALRRGVFVSIPDLEQALSPISIVGMKPPNPLSGRRPSNPSGPRSPNAAMFSKKIDPGCTLPKKRKKVAANV